jgi:hypothetical protein
MIRFSVKSLLFITTLVAAYVTMAAQAKDGPTPAGVSVIVLYFGLMSWAIFGPNKDRNCHDEPPNGAREDDENHPAT